MQGDATLTYTSSNMEIGADFTNIKDLDRNASHSVSQVRFDDVSVDTDGSYGEGITPSRVTGERDASSGEEMLPAGANNDYIRGWFFGPNHAETGGVFEKEGIIGAFGAKKQ